MKPINFAGQTVAGLSELDKKKEIHTISQKLNTYIRFSKNCILYFAKS